ncbi:MAG TPA: class I SAM-dependent methyltransferase [Acidimicrobiales bacterium]|nr:class I SAM-dependent methyltransferase [Acidimicrobiales bacterium]
MTASAVRFGPIDVAFDESLLRPRPWTLAQSEWAAELSDGRPMLEVGCGAGHIGLAAAVLSGARVVQVDSDPSACRWAAINAVANGRGQLAEQRCGRAEDVLADGERFGVVIADPPYVPSSEVHLYPEDPLGAIDGGPDGLDSVRSFLAGIAGHVDPGGSVLLQLRGLAQVDQLEAWLREPSSPSFAVAESRSYGNGRALTRLESRPA